MVMPPNVAKTWGGFLCQVFIFDIQTVIPETPPKRDPICAAMCKLVYNVVGIFRANKNILIHNKI